MGELLSVRMSLAYDTIFGIHLTGSRVRPRSGRQD